jgi:hypothetical protein
MSNNIKLPEYRLELIPTNDEAQNARVFGKYCWKELGRRFKIGGIPDFLQEEDWPKCSCCHNQMFFYAQLDTISDKYDIADSGLIYVFYCFDCNEAKTIVHSY